jgi:hypothetical protein
MEKIFLLHASQAVKLNGTFGLTDSQKIKMAELQARQTDGTKPLTKNMEEELHQLVMERLNPQLPQTAKTFLNEWYADEHEEIFNKYTAKGHMVEIDNIDFMAKVLDLGYAAKNETTVADDYFIGTCDVMLKDTICDVKSCWSKKTLNDVVLNGFDAGYELQGQVYMELYKKRKFNLFYGLLDTPAEANYDREVIYNDLPEERRFINFTFEYDESIINHLKSRVVAARAYISTLHEKVSQTLGKTHRGVDYKLITKK